MTPTLAMAFEEGFVELQASQDIVITIDDRAEAASLAVLARWVQANPAICPGVVRVVDDLLAHDRRENQKHAKQRDLAGWLSAVSFRPDLLAGMKRAAVPTPIGSAASKTGEVSIIAAGRVPVNGRAR